jgi:hypothetical protein
MQLLMISAILFLSCMALEHSTGTEEQIENLRRKVEILSNQAHHDALLKSNVSRIPYGVYPLLRDMGCTHKNLETPRLLQMKGDGRIIVDVGLGYDAKETMDAVSNGFMQSVLNYFRVT